MPRLVQLNNKASDLLGGSDVYAMHHGTGVNVLYGNGAVKWVPNSALPKKTLDGTADLIQDVMKNGPTPGSGEYNTKSPEKFLAFDKF